MNLQHRSSSQEMSVPWSASQPPIAYAEAASFVKFLIETHGKERFLEAYAKLHNTNRQEVQQRNLETLAAIYDRPLASLEQQWLRSINVAKTHENY